MNGDLLTGTIEEIAEKARRILTGTCPEAWCQEQEWDNRIDCGVKQPDGKVAAEKIALSEATETRVRECGERLLLRQKGVPVALQDEILPPILLVRGPPSKTEQAAVQGEGSASHDELTLDDAKRVLGRDLTAEEIRDLLVAAWERYQNSK